MKTSPIRRPTYLFLLLLLVYVWFADRADLTFTGSNTAQSVTPTINYPTRTEIITRENRRLTQTLNISRTEGHKSGSEGKIYEDHHPLYVQENTDHSGDTRHMTGVQKAMTDGNTTFPRSSDTNHVTSDLKHKTHRKSITSQSRDLNHLASKLITQDGLSPQCIEVNICKGHHSSEVYYYKRTGEFRRRLDEPVNYSSNIAHSHDVVPRIAHFVLYTYSNSTFQFHYMVSLLAAYRVAKAERIYFWHDNLPGGEYWMETRLKVKNLFLIHRARPTSIWHNTIVVLEHVSDVVRLEALLEYGGMYFDNDAIVVNPVDSLMKYDVTMGKGGELVLCNGILFSKPWSDFFKLWHREYRGFNDKAWGDHSVIKPYYLSRQFPNLIHVEPSSLCGPLERRDIHGSGLQHDYRKRDYVVHLSMRLWWRPVNRETVKYLNTTAGSVMRKSMKTWSMRWVKLLFSGSVEEDARSGLPRTSSSDVQVDDVHDMVFADRRRVTIQHIAETLGISFGSVYTKLTDVLHISKLPVR